MERLVDIMTGIRPQYHFRRTGQGLDAYEVRQLVRLSRNFPVRMIDPRTFAELDENHWYAHSSREPTPRSIIGHVELILACDPGYPIILDQEGRLMDGMHRVCKAILQGVDVIPSVQFLRTPEPDHVNCVPENLPYDH